MFERGVFPMLLERGEPVYGYDSDAYWIDIGTPEKYLKLNRDLLAGRVTSNVPGNAIREEIWVEDGCNIHPRAKIEGPAVIGSNCTVGSEAVLKGPCVIGPQCDIGAGSVVTGSVIWHNSRLERSVTIEGCLIAENVTIEEKAWLKTGCVLGHDVVVERNVIIEAGTSIWPAGTNPVTSFDKANDSARNF